MPEKPAPATPQVRKGQGADGQLTREQFAARFREHFDDPAFDPLQADIERLIEKAWDGYDHSRKSPRTRKAGPEFADPSYERKCGTRRRRWRTRFARFEQERLRRMTGSRIRDRNRRMR